MMMRRRSARKTWKEWQILALEGNLWPAEAFAFLKPVYNSFLHDDDDDHDDDDGHDGDDDDHDDS